ncbi:hect domain containing protein [Niveomyces insectorum RCEF 264]|uniref:HECT-type E3 ubiquitin transferase n=1 Tax=Niveomyces insectorum RCEF 264 TaxID=1081102 RepID=A0A167TZ66_9HYPO|nr:hect domain containing protein [Niveomyces insectorum RCEF 264]
MTTGRPPTSAGLGVDADLLAGLWEEAPFSRLPWDAPPELHELVDTVDNPRRVYAIHRASRRHNFQLVVQKYIVQLREGCGVSTCCNSTCFTCRKRVAGRAPLRRYNSTSARTLAVHLASQDNPEAGLCPALRLLKAPPAALSSLVFSPRYGGPSITRDGSGTSAGGCKAQNGFAGRGGPSPKDRPSVVKAGSQTTPGHRGAGTEVVKLSHSQSGRRTTASAVPAVPAGTAKTVDHQGNAKNRPDEPQFTIVDKPVSKDYRSFAANMFGTVAFKMLEWLTPAAVEEMTSKADKLQGGPDVAAKESDILEKVPTPAAFSLVAGSAATKESTIAHVGSTPEPINENNDNDRSIDIKSRDSPSNATNDSINVPTDPARTNRKDMNSAKHASPSHSPPASDVASTHANASTDTGTSTGTNATTNNARRNSNARVRTPTAAKQSQRKMSGDALPSDPTADELLPGLRSPRIPAVQGDNVNHRPPANKHLKASSVPVIPRPISQLSNAGFFDGVALEKMPPPKVLSDAQTKACRVQDEGLLRTGSDTSLPRSASSASRSLSTGQSSSSVQSSALHSVNGEDATLDVLLPQTLIRLNADVVDFVCDVLQDDHTAEQHFLEPPTVTKFHKGLDKQTRLLRRKQKQKQKQMQMQMQNLQGVALREQWRLFIEQSFFYVLSSPQALLQSFTKQGQLYDTQTLWYCMLRLTRVAPSLVFHGLWMATEALFTPPKALQAVRSPAASLFPRSRKTALTNAEAGTLMAICLHALVAAAPLVADVRKLYDMSRIRSQGLSLAGGGSVARQPPELCLQYDDAFSNDLTMRLARRTLAAITTRRYFNEMIDHDLGFASDDEGGKGGYNRGGTGEGSGNGNDDVARTEPDILAPLFAQLDFLNMDAAYILNFSVPDRTLHETRMPTLLLDWARAVMLHEWDGNPVVSGDGPFGGALALIAAIYERRQALLVGDVQFRSEYFAERLDEVEVPVAWISFTSTRRKLHLLDYPYIFSPATLVSYFRSINFSRMSRSYEESSSLQSRMNAIISPGSLIINVHHKSVLQDLLKTASTKYLILDIGRTTVLQDAFDQLWRREERELLRPLKVHLGESGGEEGFDSGGVQQEFFRLALAEALNPKYGAFTVDDRTHMIWFNPATLEDDWKFELIGLLVSLALFNGLSLPVTFPKALYRKLLSEPVNELHHIADGWPDLASGLTALLEWNEQDGAVEDVFVRTYEFSVDVFGQPISRVMGTSGTWLQFRQGDLARHDDAFALGNSGPATGRPADRISRTEGLSDEELEDNPPMVTNENRNAYVTDYIRYLTDVSVRPQFEAFARGFRRCLHPKSLTLLTPALLQSLVEGQQDVDMTELQRHARYVGWDASHQTVRDFWSIVTRYDDAMKRKLLEFVTASDRLPVGGVKNVQFVVQRNGEEPSEGGHLPTAYTCYGTLLLPEYPSREILRERLAMALENAQGFGFA